MKAKPKHAQSVWHFYFKADEDSVPPNGAEVGVMVFLLALSAVGIVSFASSANLLGAFVLGVVCTLLIAIPGRVRSTSEGFERRNLYGRGRSFGPRQKTLWGRRCAWLDVKRFDDKKNGHRKWLIDKLGEKRLAIRAKGMPLIEIHSNYPSYRITLRWAAEKLPPDIFTRPSLRERIRKMRNKEPEYKLPTAVVHRDE